MSNCPSCSLNEHSSELSEEKCQQHLRRLEHNALEAVLHAFRAQGPMTLYKEVLLDHLKAALFISREDYQFKVDHVVEEPTLQQVCRKLNPSYADLSLDAKWMLERQSLFPLDLRSHVNRLGKNVTDIINPDTVSDEQWMIIVKKYEAKENDSLAKLLTLKKKPYAPEILRRILVGSETSERIDCARASVSTQSGAMVDEVVRIDFALDYSAPSSSVPSRETSATTASSSNSTNSVYTKFASEAIPFEEFMKKRFGVRK